MTLGHNRGVKRKKPARKTSRQYFSHTRYVSWARPREGAAGVVPQSMGGTLGETCSLPGLVADSERNYRLPLYAPFSIAWRTRIGRARV